MSGADNAINAKIAISTKPARVSGLRLQAGRRERAGTAGVSTIANPRVKQVIAYIHDQVRCRVNQRGEQGHTHHRREV